MPRRRDILAASAAGLSLSTLGRAARGSVGDDRLRQRLSGDFRRWDAISGHRTGTAGDAETSAWLAAAVRDAGAEAELADFAFRRRVPGDCFVGQGDVRVSGVPLFDAAASSADGVRGRLGPLGSGSDIGLTDYEPFSGHPHTQALQDARRNARHRAIVAVCGGATVKPGLALLNADDYGAPFGPPVLQVATEHGAWLRARTAAGERVTVSAPMREETVQVSNVQARVPGRDADLAPLIVMTPCSAWWTCTAERGGGIALWLEAMRRWAGAPPERSLVFTANTGHELGHVGLQRFLNEHPTFVADAHAWVHLGANFAAAGGSLLYQASDPVLMRLGLDAITASGETLPDTTAVGARPLGEARNVFDGGGRYVSLLGSNPLFHHPDDRWPAAVDLDRTERLTRAMLNVIAQLVRA